LRADPRIDTATEERLRDWIQEFKDHQNLLCVIYDANGAVQGRTAGLNEENLPALPAEIDAHHGYDERLPDIGRHRVMAERMRLGERDFVVTLVAPLNAVDRELAQIEKVLLAAGSLALLLSAVLAYGMARKALAPVAKLRRAADAITADRLDQRLTVRNPHDELGLLTQTINAMLARLQRSFAEVRRFTADASHELRTPLTVMRSEVEMALSKSLSLVDSQQLLSNTLDELVRMTRLTDQLLALSRRDAGVEPMALTPVELNSLISGVVDAMRPLAEAKEVMLRLEVEGSVVVAGNEGLLRQVFINVLDNALKYTPEGEFVAVRTGRRSGAAVVTVEDTGIGIPAEHLPHVFERFYRVDKARARTEGGTGLGLSIAQSIMKVHGGNIELASTVGHGTICTVTLPTLREGAANDAEFTSSPQMQPAS
jgi:heavy metal sensor kinase